MKTLACNSNCQGLWYINMWILVLLLTACHNYYGLIFPLCVQLLIYVSWPTHVRMELSVSPAWTAYLPSVPALTVTWASSVNKARDF